MQVAGFEDVSAVVCLGFSLADVGGCRGNSSDDPIVDLVMPVLFVVGQFAPRCCLNDIETLRASMKALTGLIVVGGGDEHLRLSHHKMISIALTQDVADRVVMVSCYGAANGLLLR